MQEDWDADVPNLQGNTAGYEGRVQHSGAFGSWRAGGGGRRGVVDATDEHGIRALEDPVQGHDHHATIRHRRGRDRRTDVHGEVGRAVIPWPPSARRSSRGGPRMPGGGTKKP